METANFLSMTKKNEIQHLKDMLKTVSNTYQTNLADIFFISKSN